MADRSRTPGSWPRPTGWTPPYWYFAKVLRPPPAAAVPEDVRHLDALLTRRNQLIGMRVMETNRLDRLTDKHVRAEVRKHVAWLSRAIDRADAALAQEVTAGPVQRPMTPSSKASRGSDRWPAGGARRGGRHISAAAPRSAGRYT